MTATASFAQAPLNDDCSFAQVVIIPDDGDTCLSGTLLNATGDGIYSACDSLTVLPLPAGGHEVWYTYIATGTDNTITVTPSGATQAQFVSVTIAAGNCSNTAYNVCNNAAGPGGTATASWTFIPGTQVWFSVTALAADGDFTVCVRSVTPPPLPAPGVGVDCSTAIPICDKHTFISPGPVFNNATGPISCYAFGPQNVLWYKFTAGTSDSLIWMATPNPGYELDWSLNDITAGCPGVPVACNFATAPGGGAPTGMASGSVNPCGALSQICTPIVMTAGNTYALHFNIENFLNAGIDTPAILIEWGGSFKMAPYADFTVINNNGCDTVIATFVNNSVGASAYQWDFGNGNSSLLANPPPETYTVPGTYVVSLIATDGVSCANITTHSITVQPEPVAGIIASDTILCMGANDTIIFFQPSNPNYSYSWNFSGASVVSGVPGSSGPYIMNWNSPGTKNVEVTVTDNLTGCISAPFTLTVNVISVPDSTFSIPSTACEGEVFNVTFTGIQIAGSNYTWNFGGATVGSGSGSGPYSISFPASGVYDISLLVDFNGCYSDDTNTVNIIASPAADAGQDASLCSGDTVQLGLAGSPPGTYSWSPGGYLSDSTSAFPVFTFLNSSNSADTMLYILTAGAAACTAVDSVVIIVQRNLTSTFVLSDDTVCGSLPVTISYTGNGSASSVFNWDFGNGNAVNSGIQVYDVTWTIAGADSVSLSISEGGCSSDITVAAVVLGEQPVADAGADRIFCSGETDTLGTAGVPGINYIWNPASGLSSSTAPDPAITIVNSQAADDTLVYIVVASNGFCLDSDTVTVIVKAVQQASITGAVSGCMGGNPVQFSNSSQQVNGAVFSWIFSNATPASSSSYLPPPVTFNVTGPQWIFLIATTAGCPPSNDSLVVNITAVPEPGFTVAGPPGCPPLTAYFTDTATVPAGTLFHWDFGDGNISSLPGPQHVYSQPGVYNVTLTVTTPDSCSGTYIMPAAVEVYNLPVPAFTADPSITNILSPVITFSSQSVNTTSCLYIFGDGQTSSSCNTQHTYQDTGRFLVQLVAVSSQGCRDTAEQEIFIDAFESFYIPNAFTPNNDGKNDVLFFHGTPVQNFKAEIYNRWGQLIYASEDPDKGWNGKDIRSGVEVPDGVYVYKLTFKDINSNNQLKKGIVSLIR